MFCLSCGAFIDDDSNFCSRCGVQIKENPQTASISVLDRAEYCKCCGRILNPDWDKKTP